MAAGRILVVRLGAMGDIIHALPAAAALKQNHRVVWAVKPRFRELLEGGGVADEVVAIDRKSYAGVRAAASALRAGEFEFAVDFQGLVQSALVATVARTARVYGFGAASARERAAALFYSQTVEPRAAHVVDRNLELAEAAGARRGPVEFPLPAGRAEGELPERFVLAAPLAGWASKQWPMENYAELGRRLWKECGVRLTLNGSPQQITIFQSIEGITSHSSSIAGLIDATRRASAVVGVDSGPLHLAAALGKPGVALFGPTDPARNGPYGGAIKVLRATGAETTYKRGSGIAESMRALGVDEVIKELKRVLAS